MRGVTTLPLGSNALQSGASITRGSDNLVWFPVTQAFAAVPTAAAGSTQPATIPTLPLTSVAGCGAPGQWLFKDANVPACAANDFYVINIISTVDNSLVLGPIPQGPLYNEPGQPTSGSWVEYFHR